MRMTRTVAAIAGVALLFAARAGAQATQRGFSVILLLGETQGVPGGESLPPAPAIRKALADVKEFLPYKSYRVLDTQWSRSGSTHMRGPDGEEYDVNIAADEMMPTPIHPSPGTLHVVFRLGEPGAAANSSEEFSRSMAVTAMEQQRLLMQAQMNEASEDVKKRLREEVARLEKSIRMARAKRLIDSTFEMQIGETVVVGASRLGGGDKGLVVLLTSVAGGK
jgi:hypothetical protein